MLEFASERNGGMKVYGHGLGSWIIDGQVLCTFPPFSWLFARIIDSGLARAEGDGDISRKITISDTGRKFWNQGPNEIDLEFRRRWRRRWRDTS